MSEIQHAFFNASKHKRKRSENEIASPDRVIKRPTTLAIRSPPPSRPTSLFSNVSAFSPFSGQLTPVDTSEDESVTQEDIWSSNSRVPDLSNSIESASSIKVQISSPHSQHGQNIAVTDIDMDLTPSTPIRPRIGRARSNDILSSPPRRLTSQQTTLLSPDPRQIFPHDRIPTPIASHFDTNLNSHLPFAPRHGFPPIHTDLSPMIEQDTWGSLNSATAQQQPTYGQTSLPSPADDDNPVFSRSTSPNATFPFASAAGEDADMFLDEATTSSMSSLRVSSSEDDVMETEDGSHAIHPAVGGNRQQLQQSQQWQQQRQQMPGSNRPLGQEHARNASSQGGGRTARLHMGFLAGCEKCSQKVPGHYSHILWSRVDE